ncbi:hypothetical protein [Brevundimonas sp.]|uniref:hypothetical protein n=1 Tax=Brevundimonas sp. TaxID=1871086 RepID=UPI0028A815DB|nr:hypothetical protein [Brevundimonas sp.]
MPHHQSVVPPGTEHAQALHALTRKYAEFAGLIGRAKAEVQRLTADLAHIEGAIRIFDPTIDIGRIRAKHMPVREPAAQGEVTGIILDTLRESPDPLTPRELAEHLMVRRGLPVEDRELFTVMLKRVRACLRTQRGRGVLRPVGTEGMTQLWEVVE